MAKDLTKGKPFPVLLQFTMQSQGEICWTAPAFDTFIFHHIVLI